MEQKIEFREVRDFGQLVNATFLFVKQNFKPLLKAVLIICGFFVIATAVASIFYTMQVQETIGSGEAQNATKALYSWEYAVNMLFSLLFYTSLAVTVLSYISLYVEKGNEAPDVEEVWDKVKYYFLRVFGSSILLALLVIIGFIFCLAPGLYLWPATSLIIAIMVLENGSLGYSFDRGFKLIKGNWWKTFGAMFIILVVVAAAAMVVIIPITFLTAGSFVFGKTNLSGPSLIITTIFGSIAQIFMGLPYVVTAFCYFSLVEDKEGAGLMDKIDMIGQKGSDEDLPEEQY